MRKLLSLVLALTMVLSAAAVAVTAADVDTADTATGTATVTLYDIEGNVAATGEYNVGDTITCTVYLDTTEIGYIGSLKGNQTYTSSILTLADAFKETDGMIIDLAAMFPVTKLQTVANGKLDGKIAYNASTPQMDQSAFNFKSNEAILIQTHYTVSAAGEAEIHNVLETLAVGDFSLTRIITKSIVIDNRFTMNYTLSDSTVAAGVTVSGSVTSYSDGINLDAVPTVALTQSDVTIDSVIATDGQYSFANVAPGSYQLVVSKKNHVTRKYDIEVADADMPNQHLKICLIGDISGDGKVNTVDYGMANSHARNKRTLTGYAFDCGNVIADAGTPAINTADAGRINSHARNKRSLWT